MRLSEVGEFGLLRELGVGATPLPGDWVGAGDDTAVLPSPGGLLLFTTDLLVEGVHFRRETTAPADLGYKAVAVNVSDVAAMGGTPLAFTLSLALPGDLSLAWVRELYGGLEEASGRFGCPLVGGDTTSGSAIFLSVALLGRAPEAGAVLRSGARPGDDLFLSGCTGESALGLVLLERGDALGDADARHLALRHRRPEPRTALGAAMGRHGLAQAMIDVSDGLLQDVGHVLAASGVGAQLWLERIRVSGPLGRAAGRLALDPADFGLTGGEDYELLFASPPARRPEVFATAQAANTPIRRIGTVRKEAGITLLRAGVSLPLPRRAGFDHFGPAG